MLHVTTAAQTRAALVHRIAEPRVIVAPGVFDTLSALLAQQAGFEAVFFSGSAMSFSQLGVPDIGLITVPELLSAVERAAERTAVPIIVDVDSGFGSAPHAARLMRSFERAGAAAVQVEDQVLVKPQGQLLSRPLVSIDEMVGKILAMLDARDSQAMLLSARTDATDPSEAIERCLAYREAGADLVFAERLVHGTDVARLAQRMGPDVPLVYNTMHDPDTGAAALDALGVRIALFPGLVLQSAVAGMRDALSRLHADPSCAGGGRSPLPASELQAILESEDFLAQYRR
ncbi:MAG: isocitrate lyase/PEP mutase family protein [Chromatocurvus sp.]